MIKKRTRSGHGVLYVLRPLPVGFIFKNEENLKSARRRYGFLTAIYVGLITFVANWATDANHIYVFIALSLISFHFIIVLLMPERTIYDPDRHGPLE